MKIYSEIDNNNIFRACNFSESEEKFIKDYIANYGDVSELAVFSDTLEDSVKSAILGALSGSVTAGLTSSKRRRSKNILKGALAGALGGSALQLAAPFQWADKLKVTPVLGGSLGGFLSAMYDENEEDVGE